MLESALKNPNICSKASRKTLLQVGGKECNPPTLPIFIFGDLLRTFFTRYSKSRHKYSTNITSMSTKYSKPSFWALPCCYSDSCPPCRRCVEESLLCWGWWCRCLWQPGCSGSCSRRPCGRWCTPAVTRRCRWCWQAARTGCSEWFHSLAWLFLSHHIKP